LKRKLKNIFYIYFFLLKSIIHCITKHTYKIEWNFILNLWEDACQPFIIIIIIIMISLIIRNIYKNNVKVHSCLPLLLLFDHKKLVGRLWCFCKMNTKLVMRGQFAIPKIIARHFSIRYHHYFLAKRLKVF
jgi:hypothetical protein